MTQDTITNGDMMKLLWNIKNIDEKSATVFCDVGNLGLLSISLEWWNAPFRKDDDESISIKQGNHE